MYRTNAERFEEAWRLRLQYQDKPDISFTNLASFAAMRELCMAEVLSDDHHFEQVNLGFVRLPG